MNNKDMMILERIYPGGRKTDPSSFDVSSLWRACATEEKPQVLINTGLAALSICSPVRKRGQKAFSIVLCKRKSSNRWVTGNKAPPHQFSQPVILRTCLTNLTY